MTVSTMIMIFPLLKQRHQMVTLCVMKKTFLSFAFFSFLMKRLCNCCDNCSFFWLLTAEPGEDPFAKRLDDKKEESWKARKESTTELEDSCKSWCFTQVDILTTSSIRHYKLVKHHSPPCFMVFENWRSKMVFYLQPCSACCNRIAHIRHQNSATENWKGCTWRCGRFSCYFDS